MESKESKSKLHKSQLDQLNKELEEYKRLSPEIQGKVRKAVIQQINFQRNQFRKKLQESKAELKRLNLILGATGAGKSTLFNYLNDFPLFIIEGVDKNGVKNQIMKLDVDKSKISSETKIAPIGHGFVSETTIPNFSKSRSSNVTFVDCAGEFDSRDILQSIINSYFKYQLAMEAEVVKLTIAINYNDVSNNRGTIFKQILKEVGNFIGLWENFLKSQSISLVITGVDPTVNNAKGQIVQILKEISQDVKDLGLFKQILENISKREAVAIFLAPEKEFNIIINGDGKKKLQYYIPQGAPYKPDSQVCSPDIISKTLDQTKFMKCQPGLFLHNLQSNAQYLVNAICQGTIEEIKTEVMNAIVMSAIDKNQNLKKQKKPLTIEQFNSQKSVLKEKINSLSGVKEISEIISIFEVKKEFLKKYETLCQDLNEFLKISNIPNIEKKIVEVAKDITIFLSEKIQRIDKEALDFANQRFQSIQQQLLVLRDQQRKQQNKRAHDLQVLDRQAAIQRQKHERQIEQKRQNANNQMEMQKIKMKNDLKVRTIEDKKQMGRLKIQEQIKKDQREIKILQIKHSHDIQSKRLDKEDNFGAFVGKVVNVVVDVFAEKGKQIIDKFIP